jgi:hypothetical protein
MNSKGYKTELENRIREIPDGETFVVSDFSDIAGAGTIRELIRRMVDVGEIVRIMPGVYMRPRYSKLLDGQVPANIEDVAYSIARANNWTIAPSGNTALNKLGLSTQVPVVCSYVSDGPYTERKVYDSTVKFKHVANKNITGYSPVTLLVVQALKALGKDNVNGSVIDKIGQRLDGEDMQTVIAETERTTVWIRDAIRGITPTRGMK